MGCARGYYIWKPGRERKNRTVQVREGTLPPGPARSLTTSLGSGYDTSKNKNTTSEVTTRNFTTVYSTFLLSLLNSGFSLHSVINCWCSFQHVCPVSCRALSSQTTFILVRKLIDDKLRLMTDTIRACSAIILHSEKTPRGHGRMSGRGHHMGRFESWLRIGAVVSISESWAPRARG